MSQSNLQALLTEHTRSYDDWHGDFDGCLCGAGRAPRGGELEGFDFPTHLADTLVAAGYRPATPALAVDAMCQTCKAPLLPDTGPSVIRVRQRGDQLQGIHAGCVPGVSPAIVPILTPAGTQRARRGYK